MLVEKIKKRESGIVLYGIVPPKKGTDSEKIREIADRQLARLQGHDLDGLILYDIQDEAARIDMERPFPFMETLDCHEYGRDYLAELAVPKIMYRAVGKHGEAGLSQFIAQADTQQELSVFVGAAAAGQEVALSVADAYKLREQVNPNLTLGGVVIPERHKSKGDEHLRVFNKMANGCSFFVSQCIYDVDATKNFLSDYYYHGREQGIELAPIIFTLTPCGSAKTLDFMKWLGISVPRWLENDLVHSQDILQKSVDYSEKSWLELKAFAEEKGIPVGCNIESVAVRKAEVEASIELLQRVRKSFAR